MPIPDLTLEGLLPVGIHECTLAEVKERFGRYSLPPVRHDLTEKLAEFLSAARARNVVVWVAVDGSYVTHKAEPGDIDLVVVVRADFDLADQRLPVDYNLTSKRRVKQRYGFDVLVANEGTTNLEDHLTFFQRTRDGRPKGILKVTP